MTLRLFVSGIALALCSFGGSPIPVAACKAGVPTTITVLVRHADRTGDLLNEKGERRARTLRDLVWSQFSRLDAVMVSPFERTSQTVQPLIERAGAGVEKVAYEPDQAERFAGFIRQQHARGRPRTVIVFAGHSDNVRPVLELFNKAQVDAHAGEWFPCEGEICHSDYNDLWSITLCGDREPEIRKTTYGADTPAE